MFCKLGYNPVFSKHGTTVWAVQNPQLSSLSFTLCARCDKPVCYYFLVIFNGPVNNCSLWYNSGWVFLNYTTFPVQFSDSKLNRDGAPPILFNHSQTSGTNRFKIMSLHWCRQAIINDPNHYLYVQFTARSVLYEEISYVRKPKRRRNWGGLKYFCIILLQNSFGWHVQFIQTILVFHV